MEAVLGDGTKYPNLRTKIEKTFVSCKKFCTFASANYKRKDMNSMIVVYT